MFIRKVARPDCEELVNVRGRAGLYNHKLFPDAARIDGLLLLRFCGPLVFFNANHFRAEVHRAIARQPVTRRTRGARHDRHDRRGHHRYRHARAAGRVNWRRRTSH
jgi:MFS superfamily sulfate permease-like transporter